MQAAIITIGDEILIGQVVDTNSAHIAKELNNIGIWVYEITSVQDHTPHIHAALAEAAAKAPIIIVTGGLGPTKDDRTKQAICEYFQDSLLQNNAVLAHVEKLLAQRNATPLLQANKNQALVPSKATVLHNEYGTAPGLWIEKKERVFIFLPGVPYEMKALMEREVLPRLQAMFQRPFILHRTLLTYGMGESAIANRIEQWENQLPPHITLAYLPSPGKVRLRLTAKGSHKEILETQLQEQLQKLQPLLSDITNGLEDDDSLEIRIKKKFTENQKTLAVAESCTGGSIAAKLTAIPGASAYFKGSIVSYTTSVKIAVLKVPAKLIEQYSVVSAAVAESMAKNARELFEADFAIATTGNAGPLKGDSDAEVGTVFIAIATPQGIFSQEFHFKNQREHVIEKAANKAMELLEKEISKF